MTNIIRLTGDCTTHQWRLEAGPWPQWRNYRGIDHGIWRAKVDTKCFRCRLYKEHTISCRRGWDSDKINDRMRRAGIFWT